MTTRLRAHHIITAALVLGLAGCSSAASSTAQSAAAPTSTAAGAASSTPDTAATTSADADTSTSSAAPATTSAAAPSRPSDACTMLSSDQVADAVGTPGPYNDSHEDPADDGTPVWGCSWGTQASDVDFRAIQPAGFQFTPDPANGTVTALSGIGDQARMLAMQPYGQNPELQFTIGGAYYDLSVTVDRSETGATNASHEKLAEQTLVKLLLAKLGS